MFQIFCLKVLKNNVLVVFEENTSIVRTDGRKLKVRDVNALVLPDKPGINTSM